MGLKRAGLVWEIRSEPVERKIFHISIVRFEKSPCYLCIGRGMKWTGGCQLSCNSSLFLGSSLQIVIFSLFFNVRHEPLGWFATSFFDRPSSCLRFTRASMSAEIFMSESLAYVVVLRSEAWPIILAILSVQIPSLIKNVPNECLA